MAKPTAIYDLSLLENKFCHTKGFEVSALLLVLTEHRSTYAQKYSITMRKKKNNPTFDVLVLFPDVLK